MGQGLGFPKQIYPRAEMFIDSAGDKADNGGYSGDSPSCKTEALRDFT